MTDLMANILGWLGSIILIVAYWMNSKNMITAQSSSYQLSNIFGSLLLIVNTIYFGAYPSSAVNIIWVIIGIFYLKKIKKDAAKVH